MKKLFFTLAAVAALISCNKEKNSGNNAPANAGDEIMFSVADGDGIDMSVETKAVTPVTSLSKVYWEAINNGTSTVAYAVRQLDVTAGTGLVKTSVYWPTTKPTYTFRCANVAFTTSTGIITAENTFDIVAGQNPSVNDNSQTITLDHIFARTGTLTLNAPAGFSVKDITWKIKSNATGGTAGTYTIGTGWSTTGLTALSEQSITSASDMYLVPGSYHITVTYTVYSGEYSETLTKGADIVFAQGLVNHITATAKTGTVSEMTFTVSVAAWGSTTLTPELN